MIFVTVGTNEAPFDRLLAALPVLDREELVVQHGASSVRPPGALCVSSLPYDEVLATMRRADLVVTHAGVGSVLTAVAAGKRPVVVPRLRRFGQAVDDHQLEFARQMAATGLVRIVEDPAALGPALVADEQSTQLELGASRTLVEELRDYVAEVVSSHAHSR